MGNSVTLKTVAGAAGVSEATVSYVLNGRAEKVGIPPATRDRVLEAARRVGYKPNTVARDLALGHLPEGELLSCSVATLLSESPKVSPSSTTQPCVAQEYCAMQGGQPNNLTTILSSSGYRLVPVTSIGELPRLSEEGLVGVVYKLPQEFPTVSGPVPVVPPAGREDAADTSLPQGYVGQAAATTEEGAEAPVVTGVSPLVSLEGQDAADTPSTGSGQAAATTEEGAEAPVVTGACPEHVEGVPGGTEPDQTEPVTNPVSPPEVAAPVEATLVSVENNAADTSLRQGYVGQAAATTEERAAAPVVTGACPESAEGVSPVVSWEAQDAADTAATTAEGAVAPVVTGACPEHVEGVPGGTEPDQADSVIPLPVPTPGVTPVASVTPVAVPDPVMMAAEPVSDPVVPVVADESVTPPAFDPVAPAKTGSQEPEFVMPTPSPQPSPLPPSPRLRRTGEGEGVAGEAGELVVDPPILENASA